MREWTNYSREGEGWMGGRGGWEGGHWIRPYMGANTMNRQPFKGHKQHHGKRRMSTWMSTFVALGKSNT